MRQARTILQILGLSALLAVVGVSWLSAQVDTSAVTVSGVT